jgi:uncharacterized protein YdcH (DUF465 family)
MKKIKLLVDVPLMEWKKGDVIELSGGFIDMIAYKLVDQNSAEFVEEKTGSFETEDLILAASLISNEFDYEVKLVGVLKNGLNRFAIIFANCDELEKQIDLYENNNLKVNPRSYQMARNIIGKEMRAYENS